MRDGIRQLVRLMLEAEVTARRQGDFHPIDPRIARKEKMEELVKDIARALDMTQVRYLARSTRLLGAYTFTAIDENYNNVVVKIQPANELDGYKQAQTEISRLPPQVARHLPRIYKVRSLKDIGVRPLIDELGRQEELGVIVMERLEELPGDMPELITQPASKSQRSLEVLLREPEAFGRMIDDVISQSTRVIRTAISRSADPTDENGKISKLRSTLLGIINNPDALISNDTLTPTAELGRVTHDRTMGWTRQVGIDDRGAASTIAGTISSYMLGKLSRRAIPKEPRTGRPGALAGLRGVKDLMAAIDGLKLLGIMPDDVHGSNIMIRPETGELVLSDLGHFV